MMEVLMQLKEIVIGGLKEEWFWAIVTILITLLSFLIQIKRENEISRANFVYNISNDFGNNERILRTYQWLEKCRRENCDVDNYRALQIGTDTGIYDEEKKETAIDFIDIDTYVNHFEVVYVILRSVHIKNIDELFQQRFLSFMLNPYIQKEELLACFLPDENDFLLMKKWLLSICARNRFSCEEFISYMNTYTCGSYEFSRDALEITKKKWPLGYASKVKKYITNYVYYICDPACQYGFYRFTRKDGQQGKVMRVIRSAANDKAAILALQERVVQAMEVPQWYLPSTQSDIDAFVNNPEDFICLQICNAEKIVAFACVILNPTPEQDIYLDLQNHGLSDAPKARCILDTVFVDPEYRGYGMQRLLIHTLCSWAATLGKRHIAATVHPENHRSADNFLASGFAKVTPSPIPKYGAERNVFTKKLSKRDAKRTASGDYTVYPYV